ncbi:MAG: Dickkopf N-terminal cysteine-rich domain-containing protein [Kofleriaceae bacterium]
MAGCGGSSPDIDTDSQNVCSEIAEVACFNMYLCCAEGEIESILGVDEPRTEEECVSDLTRLCERDLASLTWSIDNGRASFNASAMNACLEAFVAPSESCADILDNVPWEGACEDIAWVGEQGAGEECFFNYECAGSEVGDTYCNQSRVCVARPGENMPCGDEQCASGLFCDFNTALCTKRRDTGGMCTSNFDCIEDRFCDTATMMCAPLKAVGEACTTDAMCDSNDCIPGTCEANGGSCFQASDCFYGSCMDDGMLCTADSQCDSAGTCSTGGACTVAGFCDNGGGAGECVFPVPCVKQCIGDIKCAAPYVYVDYCEAVEYIPGVDGEGPGQKK